MSQVVQLESAPEAILYSVERARTQAASYIQETNRITEQEVLALGQCVHQIVGEAQGYIQDVDQQLGSLGQDSTLNQALDRQLRSIARFHESVNARLHHLNEQARTATQSCQSIIRLGRQIDDIAMASKVLTINAAIEAARSEDSKGFKVIAQEMRRLNEAVKVSNNQIGEIAEQLLEVLPHIADQVSELLSFSAQFSEELRSCHDQVQSGGEVLRTAVQICQQLGEERLQAILQITDTAAGHLVFQDPTAQRLLRVDRILHQLQQELAATLGAGGRPVAPVLHAELGASLSSEAGAGDDDLSAGEILFF